MSRLFISHLLDTHLFLYFEIVSFPVYAQSRIYSTGRIKFAVYLPILSYVNLDILPMPCFPDTIHSLRLQFWNSRGSFHRRLAGYLSPARGEHVDSGIFAYCCRTDSRL